MAAPSFDLVDVIRVILKQKKFIAALTLVAVALGGLFYALKRKKYKAEADFFVNNPLYGDRNTLFRSYETRYVDYFGGDDDVDKITALGSSDTVIDRVIRDCDFDQIFKRGDMNNDTAHAYYMNIFKKNFNLKRTEYKDIIVSYIDYDPKTAATVANTVVQVLEESFRHYYTSIKEGMVHSILAKKIQLDSSINMLTDSLANMRFRYGIYNIMSPNRQGITSGEMKGSGRDYARAIEEIQNVESIKDQLVTDRAHYISLQNEFAASEDSDMNFLKVITRATPPVAPTGASLRMILLVAGCLGMFFSICYFLMIEYFRRLNEVLKQ